MKLNSSIKTQKILILSGVIGPTFFFALLTILGLLWEGYNPISTGMSEIGAVDSPFKDIMNYLGFSLLGIFIVIFSFGFTVYFKKNFQLIITSFLLLTGGIFLFLVGFFPCDPQCIDVTLIGSIHSLTSIIPAILIPIATMISAYSISRLWGDKWGYISFFLGVLSLASGPIMFIEVLTSYSGLIQRLGFGLSLLWIFIISLKIYKEGLK
ncbi:MAG: DUF998 domain-containing protein [Candidatus Hermodarchaeota archaeon]